jgi:PPP family 3-phenylpropionic acid transporter
MSLGGSRPPSRPRRRNVDVTANAPPPQGPPVASPPGARLGALPRFVIFYALLYAAFGAVSPFLPAFLSERGVAPHELGLLLAASTAVRLISGPVAGRLADLFQALRIVLCICTAGAAIVALCYLPAHGFWLLLLINLAHTAMIAPLPDVADALALRAAARRPGGFEYGWVRGAGSAAFIVGSLIAGQLVGTIGLAVIIALHALALAAAVMPALILPEPNRQALVPARIEAGALRTLLRLPIFVRVVLIAALVLGSHAMLDAFAVIRWGAAGISAATASLLWSEAVAAEVVVFFVLGPRLLNLIGPSGALALACSAGVLRWMIMGLTANVVAMAMTQPLHGLTFALLHLACMRLISAAVPPALAATAQALYHTVGVGLASVALTLLSGWAYGEFGARAFWIMAAVCTLALPVIWSLWRIARV